MEDKVRARVDEWLEERRRKGLERETVCFSSAPELLNLSNNDYFRLANDERIKASAKTAIDRFGCSSSASPLVSGFTPPHEQLLEDLLDWHGFEYGMLWNSGYAANQAVLSSLPKNDDWILADRLAHNSMLAGALKSAGRLIRFPHNDLERLEELLVEGAEKGKTLFVAVESVYSMDGDLADLLALSKLKSKYDFVWILDEAHALSWYGERGEGLAAELEVDDQVDILVGTLGKGLGSSGAYTLFHDEFLKRFFTNACGEYIYSTFFSPASAAAASTAVSILSEDSASCQRRAGRGLSESFRKCLRSMGIETSEGDSAVVPVVLGDSRDVLEARRRCEEAGFRVGAIRPPTVPKGTSRLRLSLNATLGMENLEGLIHVLEGV